MNTATAAATSTSRKGFLERNAQGLVFLSEQRYEEAVRTFRSGLRDLHGLLGKEASRALPKVFYELIPVDIKTSKCETLCPMVLYTKGFFLDASFDEDTEDLSLYQDAHLLSSVFLYNLALCFHLRARTKSKLRQLNSNRALSLYEMVASFFQTMSPVEQAWTELLQLAAFNNMANIHMEHFEIAAFERTVGWMQNILHATVDQDQELSFFCLNLVTASPSIGFRMAPCA